MDDGGFVGNEVGDKVGGLSFDAPYAMLSTRDQKAADCWTVII